MKRIVAAVFALSMGASVAHGAEVSGMAGLYQSEKVKNGAEKTTTTLNARYGLDQSGDKMWFAQLGYTGTKTSGGGADSTGSNIGIGGGLYYFLPKIESRFTPYLTGYARLGSGSSEDKTALTETETSGLYYGSDVGIRFAANDKWFIDFETNLFDSALSATEKKTQTTAGVKATTETTRMELFGDTDGAIASMKVGLGMVL